MLRILQAVGMVAAALTVAFASHDPVELEPGRTLELALAPGDTHGYAVPADGGQFVFVAVDQTSIDVVLELRGPDGAVLQKVDADSPWEMETLVFTTHEAGDYLVLVRAFDSGASLGHYAVTLERREALATSPGGVRLPSPVGDTIVRLAICSGRSAATRAANSLVVERARRCTRFGATVSTSCPIACA